MRTSNRLGKDNIAGIARGILMCGIMVLLAACGQTDSGPGKNTSNVKSVDDVLAEQTAKSDSDNTVDTEDDVDVSVKDTETDATADKTEGVTKDTESSDGGDMDKVNERLDEASIQAASTASGDIDVDLTQLSSTLIYSEVYNMMSEPETYLGKKIRMAGTTAVYHDETDGNDYYACVIKDATACCAQGIEFQLESGDYPVEDEEVTVVGTFSSYEIGDYEYYTLKDAVME